MFVVSRTVHALTSPEILWSVLADPASWPWLTGTHVALPGESTPGTPTFGEPSVFTAPHALEVQITTTGSLEAIELSITLEEHGEEGTAFTVESRFTPRPSWTAFLTQARLQRTLEDWGDRILDDLNLALAGRQSHVPGPPAPGPAGPRLDSAFVATNPRSAAAVLTRIRRAPLAMQSALRPLEIAVQDQLPVADVFETLVAGVARGVLELEWAVLCPRASVGESDGAKLHENGVHCVACGIRYDADLPANLEAVFRPRDTLRPGLERVERLMRGRSPKPIKTHTLDIRQSFTFSHTFAAGRYLFESNAGTLLVDVGLEHRPTSTVEFILGDDGPSASVRIPPGPQSFTVTNPLRRVVKFALTQRWRPPFPLTAATVFETPALREHLPSAFLAPGARTFYGCALAIEAETSTARKRAGAILRAVLGDANVSRTSTRHLMAVSDNPAEVLTALEQMVVRQVGVGAGIGMGTIVVLPKGLHGSAVSQAQRALDEAGPPQLAVCDTSVDALQQAIDAHGRLVHLRSRLGRPALLVFAAVVDGAPAISIDEVELEPLDTPERPEEALTQVGGMRILKSIDRGGVGEIYEVEDPKTGKHLAAKVIHPHLATKRFIQLFHKEGYYTTQLRHPNIVLATDWGSQDGLPYLVMELLTGHNLYHHVKHVGTFSPPQAVHILCAMLDALQVVHEKGWVHRDIKPHNIFLLDEPGDVPAGVKLLDFGLTRPAGQSKHERFAGTPEFMAPEQVELGHVDARADVYSIGALCYYLIAGKPPFRGKTRGEGAVLRLEGLPEDLEDVLGPLTPVVERALALDKESRWESAAAMRTALEQAGNAL